MPKPLFYLGVIFCALTAVIAISVAPSQLNPAEPPALARINPIRPLAMLFFAVPVAALFLRMASLIAARNLFAAVFAIFAVGCTSFSVGLLSTVQFRQLLLIRRSGGIGSAGNSLSELQLIALYAAGFFLSLTLLALRPYFRLQGRVLPALLLVPVPLYLAMLIEQFVAVSATEAILGASSTLTFLYLVLSGSLLAAVSVHCLRHRHQFVEVTNLRELLDAPVDPTIPVRRRNGFRFDTDVAFDS